MRVCIKLNKDIQCDYICNRVQNLVNKFRNDSQDISEAVLIIDIKSTTDGGDNHIPKLEYHPDSPT